MALVPLFLVLHFDSPGPGDPGRAPRGARWAPWVMGIVYYVLTFWWIVRLPSSAMTHPLLIYPALVTLGLYLGLYVAVFGWIVRFVRRRLGWPVLLTAPFAWMIGEWLKSTGELGCPWGNVGYALAPHPAWIQGASVAGAAGLSFWIVTVNALIAGMIVARGVAPRLFLALVIAATVALPPLWGAGRLRHARTVPIARVALIQPNVSSEEKWIPALQDSITDRMERLTRAAAAGTPRPDLVIWPETSLPYYVRLETAKMDRLLDLAKEIRIPILLGYPDARLDAHGSVLTSNAAGLVLASGRLRGQYDKIHLVPFGERIPFQGLFPFLGHVDLGQAEWTPGTRTVVFTGAGPAFGVLICFESIFPNLARKYAIEGAQYLVNITNDEWFGKTAGPVQHADLAILRSVELGMGLARCANTGISMLIDPYGRVTARTPLFAEAILTGEVDQEIGPTLYAEWGDWITALSIALMASLVAVAWFRPIGAAGTAGAPPPG